MGTLLLLQADAIGESFGKGFIKLIEAALLIVAAVAGFILFLWLVRKIDKKINRPVAEIEGDSIETGEENRNI
jgi:hypothetical protein